MQLLKYIKKKQWIIDIQEENIKKLKNIKECL